MEKMNEEHKTPLEFLTEWREQYGETLPESSSDVVADVREMCRCMRMYPAMLGKSRVYRLLRSWYMPCNMDDAEYYRRRYRMWCRLPQYVPRLLTDKNKNDETRDR